MTTSKYRRVQEAIGQLKDVCFESNWPTAMALINEISMVIVDELCEKAREKETAASPATVHQQLKCEIAEDLSEIESHGQFIQRKSVRVRELVRRLSHV